jgi:hypothetical protein
MQARWWYRHLCDPQCEEQELPRLSGLAQPDADPQFWPAVHTLVAQGLPERAVQLLQLHPALRGGVDEAGLSAAEAGLLVRLEALLEEMPRLAHPDLVGTPQPEATALMHQQQLADFQASWRVWTEDVAALRSDAAAATAAGAPLAYPPHTPHPPIQPHNHTLAPPSRYSCLTPPSPCKSQWTRY